jgi:hypothetical protein
VAAFRSERQFSYRPRSSVSHLRATKKTVVDETDYDLIVALWEKACARVSVRRIEAELAADAFRIHRPLAQWLEEGALRIAAPPEAAPAAPAAGA